MRRGIATKNSFLTGARLALLAIALQLVLSFGHMHPLPAAAAAVQQIEAQHDAPWGSDDGLNGDCAICVNIAAFSTLDVPQTGTLSLPARAPGETLKPRAAVVSAALAAFPPFNSRAPPSA